MRGLPFPEEDMATPNWSTPYGRTKEETTGKTCYLSIVRHVIVASMPHPLYLLLPRCDSQWSLPAKKRKMVSQLFSYYTHPAQAVSTA